MEAPVKRIKDLRKEAARRKRRIVMHSDGQPLERAIGQAAGTQVDLCTYSLVHQFNLCRMYRTNVGQEWPPSGIQLDDRGRDGLQIYLDFCHANGIEAFWAMRMNDTHDAGDYEDARNKLANNTFKQEHPDWLVGTEDTPPPHSRWTSVNYEQPEVREQAFRLWEDVAKRYDIDGFMFDFFRHPTLFKSAAWGQEVSDGECESMTELMRRTRKMTDEIGAERGRPILLSIRAPDSVGYCNGIGIDLETWMAEDLIDIWMPGGYFRLREWSDSVALGHRYGIQVWPSLDECRVQSNLPQVTDVVESVERGITANPGMTSQSAAVRNSLEAYRARFVNALNAGADTAYLFNFQLWRPPDVHYQLLDELGDPETLTHLNKMYCPVFRGRKALDAGYWLKDGERFYTRPNVFSPEDPKAISAGESQRIDLNVGDDLARAETKGFQPTATLCLQVEGLTGPTDLTVFVNGQTVTGTRLSDIWMSYIVSTRHVNKGSNRVEIAHNAPSDTAPVLHDLQLWITYARKQQP